jgi:hypothetical protein
MSVTFVAKHFRPLDEGRRPPGRRGRGLGGRNPDGLGLGYATADLASTLSNFLGSLLTLT